MAQMVVGGDFSRGRFGGAVLGAIDLSTLRPHRNPSKPAPRRDPWAVGARARDLPSRDVNFPVIADAWARNPDYLSRLESKERSPRNIYTKKSHDVMTLHIPSLETPRKYSLRSISQTFAKQKHSKPHLPISHIQNPNLAQ